MRRTSAWASLAAAGALALVGCGSTYGSGSSGASSSSASSSAGSGSAVLATADSGLGKIVVDGSGRTVYVFDKDEPGSGTSACSGQCLANWPAVTTTSDHPQAKGVTGDVGTMTRDDGTKQVTLDGLPLYTFAADAHAGDTSGQGVQGVWWVVGPTGAKITGSATGSSAPSSSSDHSGGY